MRINLNKLEKCPCGKVPEDLDIYVPGAGKKWAYVSPTCCGIWEIEFKTHYLEIDGPECKELAIKTWNEADRG